MYWTTSVWAEPFIQEWGTDSRLFPSVTKICFSIRTTPRTITHDSQHISLLSWISPCLPMLRAKLQWGRPTPLRLVLCTRNGQNGMQTDFLSSAWFSEKSLVSSFAFLSSLSFHYLVLPPFPHHHVVWKTCFMALFLLHYFGVFLSWP